MNLSLDSMFGNFLETYKAGPALIDEKRLSDRALLNKLQQFGIKVDKTSLQKLGKNVIAIEQICDSLTEHLPQHTKDSMEFDWVFLSLMELWRRWYPDSVNFEMLQLRVQNIMGLLSNDNLTAAARVWYKTWPLFLRFFDMCDIESAPEFRSRFPRFQELLDSILGVAEGLADDGERRHFLDARILFCEQLLDRLAPASEQDEVTDGIRAILADAYMITGEEEKVDALYQRFLDANPTFSFAYSDWFYCYHRVNTPEKDEKAESILRQGLKALDARQDVFDPELFEHRKHLLVMLLQFLEKQDRVMELQEVRERLDEFQEPEEPKARKTMTAEEIERDLFMRKVLSLCLEEQKAPVIGRNERCPCLSGVKFKRCCGRDGTFGK